METKHLMRSLLKIAMTAFLVFVTGNAFAIENKSRVVSPYWQVDAGSYTFIAVSHSSLSGMASQIGITVNAITSAGTAYATAESFTVTAGNTERVFIVTTNHATINPTAITTAKFLAGTTDFTYGHRGSVIIEANTTGFAMEFIGDMNDSTSSKGQEATISTSGLNIQ